MIARSDATAVIDRYRGTSAARRYTSDSGVVSPGDIACINAGFLLARRLPVWAAVSLVVAIRDNLTLNMLIRLVPDPPIRAWQGG